ncbi:MAG: ABC transporter permease [bacterium]
MIPTAHRLRRLARSILRRHEIETEMQAEMRLHVELETEELVRGGMPLEEARRQAAIAFGGLQRVTEDALDEGSVRWLDGARRDVRIAMRALLRQKTFAITATLAMALAIAVNTTMFSMLDGMINPTVGVREPERVFYIQYFGDPRHKVDFAASQRAIDATVGTRDGYTGISGNGNVSTAAERGGHVAAARVARVRENFFPTLGVTPLAGRLTPGSDLASSTSSIVISARLRAALFNETEASVGASIIVDGETYTVIGVVERFEAFDPLDYDAWTFAPPNVVLSGRLVRLQTGTTLEQTQQRLDVLAAQLALAASEPTKDTRFYLKPVLRQFHANRFHYALIGSGLAILLVACTNLANLQLARGLTRGAELAVRSSLGASRRQIVTQLVLECGLLSAVALGLALLFAVVGNAVLRATIPPTVGEFVVQPHGSWRMVAVASLAAVVCLLAIGLLPAIRVSRIDLNALLKGRAGTGAHQSNRRLYGLLVVVQIALTLPLVCAAALLSREAARTADMQSLVHDWLGYDPTPLVHVGLTVPKATTPGQMISLADKTDEVVSRARTVPGVVDAAIVGIGYTMNSALTVDDPDGALREVAAPIWRYNVVSVGYFKTFGLPFLAGHGFEEGRFELPLGIVDARTAAYLWPRSVATGRLIKMARAHTDSVSFRVVGVVGDLLTPEARDRQAAVSLSRVGSVYRLITARDSIPLFRRPQSLQLVVRTTGNPAAVAELLRQRLRPVSASTPLVTPYTDYLGIPRLHVTSRFFAAIFTTFAALALGLSLLGVYAIVAQSVIDRQREVAVRIALGATSKSIVYTLIREGNVLVLAGVALGLFLTKETVGWIAQFLQEEELYNAPFFAAMCIALFAITVAAALLPAIRATRLEPMQVLRAD